jgi:hypothetical protein
MKYLIISKPKSGTHLLMSLFANFNIINSNIRIDTNYLSDSGFRYLSYTDHIKMYNVAQYEEFPDTFNKIPDGHFAHGHIEYTAQNSEYFKDFKKVLLVRDHHEIRESRKRQNDVFNIKNDLLDLSDESLNNIEKWENSQIFKIEFNDLINKRVEKIDALQEYLFGKVQYDSLDSIELALLQPNLMKHPFRPGEHFDLSFLKERDKETK